MLRGDNVNDDKGCQAVSAEESSSSPMTAANVLDTISRLPGMAGESNDAVHASYKLTSLRTSVWKGLYQKITKITSLERGTTR